MPPREHHHQIPADEGGGDSRWRSARALSGAEHLPHLDPRCHRQPAVELRRRRSTRRIIPGARRAGRSGAGALAAVLRTRAGPGSGLVVFAARDPRGALHGALVLEATAHRWADAPANAHRPARSLAACCNDWRCAWPASKPPRRAMPVASTMVLAVTLYVQQLLKLRSSGRTRRYEVLLRSDAPMRHVGQRSARRTCWPAPSEPASGGKLDREVRGRAVPLAGRQPRPA